MTHILKQSRKRIALPYPPKEVPQSVGISSKKILPTPRLLPREDGPELLALEDHAVGFGHVEEGEVVAVDLQPRVDTLGGVGVLPLL